MADIQHGYRFTGGSFDIGDRVTLRNLVAAEHLNGRSGVIATDMSDSGRYGVDLDKSWTDPATGSKNDHRLSIKPSCLARELDIGLCCYCCHKQFPKHCVEVCSRCKMVDYCSVDCQKRHWKETHKQECEGLRKARKAKDQNHFSSDPRERADQHYHRGKDYLTNGQGMEAETEFRAALVDDDDPHILAKLGLALFYQGKNQEAIQTMQTAIDQESRPAKAADEQLNLAMILLSQGSYERALALFQSGIELSRNPTWQHYKALAQCYRQVGNTEEALASYHHAIALDQAGAKVHAEIYNEMGFTVFQEIEDFQRRSTGWRSGSVEEWETILRKMKKGSKYMQKAMELDPTDPVLRSNLNDSLDHQRTAMQKLQSARESQNQGR